jgi:hypothetical protein
MQKLTPASDVYLVWDTEVGLFAVATDKEQLEELTKNDSDKKYQCVSVREYVQASEGIRQKLEKTIQQWRNESKWLIMSAAIIFMPFWISGNARFEDALFKAIVIALTGGCLWKLQRKRISEVC